MQFDSTEAELAAYTASQLNALFPDRRSILASDLRRGVPKALDRLDRCFREIANPAYSANGEAVFDALHADQYCSYLYLLANTLYQSDAAPRLLEKLFYLNKALHAFNCRYDCQLPEVFWLVHPLGTVLNKAAVYGNYLVVRQNCTVGAIAGRYPHLGERVILSAGATILGGCTVGSNVVVGSGAVITRDVPDDTVVLAGEDLTIRPNSERSFALHFHPIETPAKRRAA